MAEKFLTQEQLSVFCSSLAILLRSGASLSEASSLFEEDGMDTALRQASTEISLSVAAGETFSAAAEKTGVFPEYALSVFNTAELSGRLDEALDRLADHYDRQSALYDRLRSTLTYPAVLMLMMCGVLAVLVFAVLPMFERVYDNLTGSLLSSSYAYVLAATLIGRISLVFAGLLGIVLLVLAFAMRSDKGREKLRNAMETSRFTRKAAWLLAVSEVMGTLSALLASGTDEDSALALCIEQTRHQKLHEALEKCREETQMGIGIATAFAHQKDIARHVRQNAAWRCAERRARAGDGKPRAPHGAGGGKRAVQRHRPHGADFDRISHRVCRFDAFKRHAALARHFERNLREKLWVF